MESIRITHDLTLELYRLDEDGRAVLALVQTAPGQDRSAVWLRLDEVKAVIAALTEGAIRLVDEEVGE